MPGKGGIPIMPVAMPCAMLAARLFMPRGWRPTPILCPPGGVRLIRSPPLWPRTRCKIESCVRSMARLMWPTMRFSRPPRPFTPLLIALGPVGLDCVSLGAIMSLLAVPETYVRSVVASSPPLTSISWPSSMAAESSSGTVAAFPPPPPFSLASSMLTWPKSHVANSLAPGSLGPRFSRSPESSAAMSCCVLPLTSIRTMYSDKAVSLGSPEPHPTSTSLGWISAWSASDSGVLSAISTGMVAVVLCSRPMGVGCLRRRQERARRKDWRGSAGKTSLENVSAMPTAPDEEASPGTRCGDALSKDTVGGNLGRQLVSRVTVRPESVEREDRDVDCGRNANERCRKHGR